MLRTKDADHLRFINYVLIADDDLDDQVLIRDALIECGHSEDKIKFVLDGEELISALEHASKLPDLILLDLNMPRKGGKEVLNEIRSNSKLRLIPIVMLSTSDSDTDIKECYALGSNTYITKPRLYSELLESMEALTSYWFTHATLIDG
ncbi:response regulator [Ningiella sp. W23]|uniref:response regulator n=1 Tax=Ningiella sp. W23 TaxID=3023715 RepID=UPI003756C74F